MVGYEVLEDLYRRHPRLPFIGNACLPTDAHDHIVVMHAVDQVREGVREDLRIGVDLRGDE